MGAFYGTFIEHWPPEVAALSFPTRLHTLSEEDVTALLTQHAETRALLGYERRARFSEALLRWVEEAIAHFPGGAFVRLGACSFVTPERGPRAVRNGEQAVKLLMHPGERAASLAYRCYRAAQPVALCVREWRDIAPSSEFRIFIRNREVVGASQYHWRRAFPELEGSAAETAGVVRRAASSVAAASHLESVVADIYLTGTDAEASWVLIELNPYSTASGPCLFSWEEGFDGTFRYLAPDGSLRALPLSVSDAPGV